MEEAKTCGVWLPEASRGSQCRRAEGCILGVLCPFAKGFSRDLFGDAGAFAALCANAQGNPHITISAAAALNCATDLTIGNTLAKTYVHRRLCSAENDVFERILILMRMIVKVLIGRWSACVLRGLKALMRFWAVAVCCHWQ
ncbi:hypothetical protein GCM10017624_34520 [Azotobacter vinelandii]|nr:hypothetical protein GCM10017624_34520 [Azotobacter vinelandii]